ncbi:MULTISPECIES: hypothetical protein [Streptomyces]|uniref:Uncharacterized protein n=1 Tax=Streptomyces venezuelae TaxID=54571 RepID=A0A5P2BEN6_STRVZ|nr:MULTISPECIES: hypothetical protein [Streptomyces]NDZ99266.1 hypothetical protein [Streptomyces sp. SID10116]MYY80434.1 hypothetical protein [Streptomyces sp. SID335]MYZ15400.1 hypothetical protein [Streptomyces sp. SID337]NDZ91894.1 hypothetical protein [Streptomyces sp. SID10115]NEB44394.1 hypothetical protein [Streptomyces sp. SID339]
MSYGDPNNPYGQPPQQPPAAPGYGYPQQGPPGVPPQQPYGYPQQPAYPGYPGGNMMQQSMPGLLVTARVFLFLISAVQILGAIGFLYLAAIANDVSDSADDFGLDDAGIGDAAAGVFVVLGLIAAGLATLSITLGVKFSRGGQGVRITTVVYGALGAIVGLIYLFVGLDTGLASAIIGPLIWLVFGVIITLAPVVPSGTAWFNRPRY